MYKRKRKHLIRADTELKIVNKLIKIIYKKQEDYKYKQMCKLAKENRRLKNKKFDIFVYKNKWYIPSYITYSKQTAKRYLSKPENRHEKILDPSLFHKAEEILKETFDEKIERNNIEQCIKHIVNRCATIQNLQQILPSSLIQQIDLTEFQEAYNRENTVSSVIEIEDIKNTNKKHLKTLKGLLLLNVITPED